MSRERPFAVGLLGFGLAGAAFHAPLIAAEPGLRLAAVVTRDPGRREEARRRYPEARLLGSAEELWERSSELDLAVVATPNRTHAALATAALEAGLAVVVDKPLAASAAEGRRIAALAAARGRALVPFHNRRWDGDFLTLRRLLAEGRLGELRRLESRFERWRPEPKPGWRQSGDPADAGGVLWDLGSHLVDQALLLGGPVERVYAELEAGYLGAEVENDAFVALTHRSGVRSHLWASSLAAAPGPRFRVLGSLAGWRKEGLDPQEAALRAGAVPGGPGWGEEPPERWGRLTRGTDEEPVPTVPGDYPRFYAGVVATLAHGAPAPVTPAEGVAVLTVLEAAHAAGRAGRGVELAAAPDG